MSRISTAQTLIRSLNPTPLRTSNSQQLNAALENITTRAFANPSAITPGSREGQALDGMIGSLECLKAGKAMADFPLSNKTLRPAHDPHYYERIMDGIHNSQKGQGRSWWKSFFQLKGRE